MYTESCLGVTAISGTHIIIIAALGSMLTSAKVTRVNSTQVGIHTVGVTRAFTDHIVMTHSHSIGVGKVIMGAGVIIHTERHKVGSTASRALEIQDLFVRSGLDENLRRTQSYVACQSNTESSGKSISSRIGTFEFDSIEQRGTADTGVSTHRDVGVAFLRGNVTHNAIVGIGPVFVETDAKVTDGSWAT